MVIGSGFVTNRSAGCVEWWQLFAGWRESFLLSTSAFTWSWWLGHRLDEPRNRGVIFGRGTESGLPNHFSGGYHGMFPWGVNLSAMAWEHSRRTYIVETRVQFQASPCRICGGKKWQWVSFFITSVFPCQNHLCLSSTLPNTRQRRLVSNIKKICSGSHFEHFLWAQSLLKLTWWNIPIFSHWA